MNTTMKKLQNKSSNDIYHTPPAVVKIMIDMCDITPDMSVLDPCYGAGAFYENLPECNKSWCEIEKGVDFFENHNRYDLVIGNPPYSLWTKWLEHTIKITDKFCYIFGTLNLTNNRLKTIIDAGYGITKFHLLKIDWWFSPSFLVLFEKNKPSIISVSQTVNCEFCNKSRCKRRTKGNNINICPLSQSQV